MGYALERRSPTCGSGNRARFALGWVLTLPLLAFLLILCVQRQLAEIPADISSRVQQRLETAGYPLRGIHVEGRDVFLRGVVNAADADRIVEIVKSVQGVRQVWIQFQLVRRATCCATVFAIAAFRADSAKVPA